MFLLCSEELAKIALKKRSENISNIRKAKCVSISEYRAILSEITKLEDFLTKKRKAKFGL